ncbi:vWA domain-containing protein [Pedobacter insulae]|uniref:N-terminal double-transmembrane domain-containing protein n=1 Tax=Pedobacter insulae TaxID=414048 RepID=A0A1I2VQ91_9SPHI|nr:BatA and WFA domain-containing protein [Pedobacter insulae]SFG89646.1 N-terminal double-transmembrane domain-containing protein [Pedobacter insulae]
MNFLYPGFLFALLSIAIPVIIHLFNFRKFKKVYFSNVAFLKEIKEQNSSQEKLKNLLILISRILAIIFLVLAFSRPFIPSGQKNDLSKTNIVSIYIDNSYSMEAVNKEGNLLDEAKRKAKEIVKAFQLNDRFQLLTNDFEGRHQRLLNADELMRAIDEVKISAASRRLQQVINRQQNIFTGSSNRFSYIISDFQKGFAGEAPIAADKNLTISLIRLKSNHLPNVAVDSVWMLSPVHQTNGAEKIVVRLKNYSDETAKNIPVKLSINNQQKGISSLTIEAGSTQVDTLSFSGLNLGWQKGELVIKDFPLTFDDGLKFSFNVSADQKVLSINGATTNKYIKALFNADQYFRLTEMPESNINYSALSGYSLIVLNELNNPSTGLADALRLYVENGGSVVIFPNLNAQKNLYNQFFKTLNLPIIADLIAKPTKVSSIELKNPLFKEVFESLPEKLDLPEVKRYLSFTDNNTRNKESLLQLPANQLFFTRYPRKDGQVYLAATGLSADDSNLAEHPIFVPLMYKIAFASVREQPLYYVVMKDNVLESNKVNLNSDQSLKLVADNFEVIPEIRQTSGKTLLYVADQVKKSGFYDLKQVDSVISVIAFNDNRTESDMHYDEPSALNKILNKEQMSLLDPASDSIETIVSTKNKGTELWKLCLILSVIFLAIEILLVRFYHIKHHSNS